MNTELVTTNGAVRYAAPTFRFLPTEEQSFIIKNQICKDLTDSEFLLFMEVCKGRGLNPLLNQIYAIRRYKNEKDNRGNWNSVPTMTIQTSIEGFTIVAERTGKYEGCKTWTTGEGKTLKAHAIVYKKGSRDIEVEIDWEEFKQVNKSGEAQGMWAKMPKWMLQKVALARALSRAFPEDLSGLYTTDEMPVEPQKEVTGPAAQLREPGPLADDLIGDHYKAQMMPPITTAEPLDNPWLFKIKRAGKEKFVFEIHDEKPEWFKNIRARFEQGKMTEEEFVNCESALEQPHLKAYAIETVQIERETAENMKEKLQKQIEAMKKEGNDNE